MKMRPIPWRVKLGYALREMVNELELPSIRKRWEQHYSQISPFTRGIPKPLDYEELTLVEPKTIWPLKRDPKTGRMMKPCME